MKLEILYVSNYNIYVAVEVSNMESTLIFFSSKNCCGKIQ